jgi:hypothetical protein
MLKFKADNIGCGDCRMKAVSNLVASGANKVSFDMAKSHVIVDQGPLSVEKVIELIEKASIFVEGVVSDVIRLHVTHSTPEREELETLLRIHHPRFVDDHIIEFDAGVDLYDIEDVLQIYGFAIQKIEKT